MTVRRMRRARDLRITSQVEADLRRLGIDPRSIPHKRSLRVGRLRVEFWIAPKRTAA